MPASIIERARPQVAGAAHLLRGGIAAQPWRVMLLLSNLTLDGGAEVQSIQLATQLKQRGWDVQVVSILPPKQADVLLAEQGIPVHSLALRNARQAPLAICRLVQLLRQQRPHILHAHMVHAILLARFTRALGLAPVSIGTLHGLKMYNVNGRGWRVRELLNGLTDRLSDVTSVVCSAAARHYRESHAVSRKRLRIIPNGIDVRRFQAEPESRRRMRASLGLEGEFAWLLVGRFQPVKDHYTMLRSFARVCAADSNQVLLLAGDGPLHLEMKEFAKALGIGARVRFLGATTGVPALMNAADACVLSSIFEAMPLVLLEAAATGLPAVATDVGGNSDVVVDGITGFLAPPSNPDALAQAMLRLTSLPLGERLQMGARAREHVVANYRLEDVAAMWEELYTELLSRKGIRP